MDSSEAKIVELTAKLNEQQRLVQKLEDDILKVCAVFSPPILPNPGLLDVNIALYIVVDIIVLLLHVGD